MIHFENVQTFPLPVAEVAAKLSDAGFLAHCVPDAQVTEATPDKAVGKIKPKLSFLTGHLTLTADVTAREPGKSVAYQLVTKGIGASTTVVARLDFKDADGGGTAVQWTGDLVSRTGFLKVVSLGLMEGAAKKVIEDMWAAIAARLTASKSG